MKIPVFSKVLPKGSVLVFSLLVLAILLVTSLTILSTAVLDRKASLSTGTSTRSFQVADSGVEEVLYRIYKENHATLSALASAISSGSCSGSSISFPASGGSVKVTFYESETAPYSGGCSGTDWRNRVVKIKSEGTAGSNSRAVEVAVAAGGGPLQCVTGYINKSGTKGVEDQINTSGNTWSDIFQEDPYIGGEDAWGLECKTGWARTGCAASELGSQGTMDGDLSMSGNGCKTDNEERANGTNLIQAVCCRT